MNQLSNKRQITLLLLLGGLTVGVLNFSNKPESNKLDIDAVENTSERSYSDLPWQIDTTPEGHSQVFGLTLGTHRLNDAVSTLGPDHQLALIETPNSASLEMYDANYKAGPIKGRLVLVADITTEQLQQIRKNAVHVEYLETGNKKFSLATEDKTAALVSLIRTLTFIPATNLNEEIIQQRFGEAEKVINGSNEETIFLFPKKGLSISLHSDAKEVLQYVAPKNFELLTKGLLNKNLLNKEIQLETKNTPL